MAVATRSKRTAYIAPFNVLDVDWDARGAMLDKSKIVLLTGSKGGGKSRLAGEKIHAFCLYYSGATGLIVRKAREFMSNGTVPFMQNKVIGPDPHVEWNGSQHRWNYSNGSMLATGGMLDAKQREAVRSIGQDGALDIIWVEEANALTWDDFQELIGCLRGKAAPWCQIILTCNPDGPLHWINQKLILGKMAHVYLSSAADNPNNPPGYVENTLSILTGVMRERLVLGKWVQAEGVIYDNFSIEKNVQDVAYNPEMPVIWGVDDGYAAGEGPGKASYHPRVFLVAQEDGRGGFNVLAERYSTGEASYDTSIDAVLELGFPPPQLAYIDSSAAMMRGALTVRGIPNMGATHPVVDGLRNVRRLICDGNAQTLLHIHPRCTDLITEMQMYSYDETAQVSGDRKPAKVNDHGPDALRYMTWHARYDQS